MGEFYALSQISFTIAGFAALFSILKINKGDWTNLDKLNLIRFYVMIELACLVSIYSFFPIILTGYFNTEISFRLSFGLCSAMISLYMIYSLRRNKKYSNKIAISGLPTIFFLAIVILLLVFALLGTFDFIGNKYKTNYLVLLFVMFMQNIYLFIRLIYFTVRKE